MATERFSLLLETRTTGAQDVANLEASLKRIAQVAQSRDVENATKRNSEAIRRQAETIKDSITNPLGAATDAAQEFVLSYGKVGAVTVGVAAGIAAASIAVFNLAKSTGELAEKQANAAQVLGITIREYGELSAAVEDVGVSAESLLGSVRGLSKAIAESSEEGKQGKRALADIGVAATDAFGAVKPLDELLLEIADSLGSIENPALRADAAIKILGKGGLTLLPALTKELRTSRDELRKLGVGFSDEAAAKAKEFDARLDNINRQLGVMKKLAGDAAISLVNLFADIRTPAEKRSALDAAVDEQLRSLEATRATREGRDLSLSPGDIKGALPRGIGPGLTRAQLDASLRRDARAAIEGLVNDKDDQARLKQAREQVAEAVRIGDLTMFKTAQSRVASLEATIKATEEAARKSEELRRKNEALAEKETQYWRDVLQHMPSQLRGVTPGMLMPESLRGTVMIDQAPSLFRAGESRGDAGQGRARAEGAADAQARANQRQVSALQQEIELQARKVELLTGPGGEVDAVNQITAIRLAGLEKQKQLGGDLFQIQLEQSRVLQDRELQILQIRKQQREEVRNAGEGLFDAALGGGGGLKRFALSQALVPARAMAGNLAVELFGGSTGKFTLPGLTGPGGQANFGGRLLQGTPFGLDPLKGATDLNTQATIQNTAALVSVSGAGGVAGGALQSVLGGGALSGVSSVNPLIFHALGGGGGDILSQVQNQQRGTRGLETLFGIKSSTGSALGRGVGIAGLLGGAAFGAYSGFSAGGAQGGLTGSSSILGGVAGLLPLLGVTGPAAPILAAGALGLAGIAALIGDPKKKEAERIDKMLDAALYPEAIGRNYMTDTWGRATDYNQAGQIRVYQVNVNVDTMDAASFRDNAPMIIQTWTQAIKDGQGGDAIDTIRQGL